VITNSSVSSDIKHLGWNSTDVSEEYIATIFRTDEYAKLARSRQQVELPVGFLFGLLFDHEKGAVNYQRTTRRYILQYRSFLSYKFFRVYSFILKDLKNINWNLIPVPLSSVPKCELTWEVPTGELLCRQI
jgi:hypothetical protein